MKQDNRFSWVVAWIFTVVIAALVLQDAGMRGEAVSITGMATGMEGVSGMAVSTDGGANSYDYLFKDAKDADKVQINKKGYHKIGYYFIGVEGNKVVRYDSEKDIKSKNKQGEMPIPPKGWKITTVSDGAIWLSKEYSDSKFLYYDRFDYNVPGLNSGELLERKDNNYQLDTQVNDNYGWSRQCFLPITPITLSDNSKKQIQHIQKGDKVLSYDLEKKEIVASEVLNVFSHEENEYLIVNEKIKVTPYHNMYINGEWKQIGKAKVGDELMDSNGNKIKIKSIEKAYDENGVMVYDLEIKEHHYYFAEGVLVHNSGGFTYSTKGSTRELFDEIKRQTGKEVEHSLTDKELDLKMVFNFQNADPQQAIDAMSKQFKKEIKLSGTTIATVPPDKTFSSFGAVDGAYGKSSVKIDDTVKVGDKIFTLGKSRVKDKDTLVFFDKDNELIGRDAEGKNYYRAGSLDTFKLLPTNINPQRDGKQGDLWFFKEGDEVKLVGVGDAGKTKYNELKSGKSIEVVSVADMEKSVGIGKEGEESTDVTLAILKAQGDYTSTELKYKNALKKAYEAKQKYEKSKEERNYKEAQKYYKDYLNYKKSALKIKSELPILKEAITDAQYDTSSALGDIDSRNKEKQDKALFYLENLVNNPDTSSKKVDEVLKELEKQKNKNNKKAQELAKEIKLDKNKEERAKEASTISGQKVTWDRQNNKFKSGSQTGDGIEITTGGKVNLYDIEKAPTEEETTKKRMDLSKEFIQRLSKELQENLEVDELGNIYDTKTGEWIVGLKTDKETFKLQLDKKTPDYIVVDGKKITKFKDYKYNDGGVYRDDNKVLYGQATKEPITDGQIEFDEEFEENKDIKLRKFLETDDNGKLTSEVARTQIIVKDKQGSEKPLDIDTETYKTIKDAKGKGIKPEYNKDTNQLTISIGDKDIIFGNYEVDDKGKASGYKRIEQFKEYYVDKDGKLYTPERVKKMKEEEREKLGLTDEPERIPIRGSVDFLKDGETVNKAIIDYIWEEKKMIAETAVYNTKTGDYEYYYVEKEDGKAVIAKFDENGVPVGDLDTAVVTFKDGLPVVCKKGGEACSAGWKNTIGARANSRQNQFESRRFFEKIDFALTEFRGLGYYATLFMSDEALGKWRESVDKIFAEMYLGVEYWTSAICSSNIERDQQGVAYVDTASGLAGVAAHVEATRSDPITSPNATEYLYKITFYVQNGDWKYDPRALEEMKFNVYLHGDRTARLLREEKKLKKGEGFGMTKANAFVQYSSYYYDKICIKFDDVPSFWSLDGDKLCNTMQVPPGEAERVPGSGSTQQQTTTGEPESEFLVI